jgi:hypothetical protein
MLAAYAVKSGFEVIARMNQFVLILVVLSITGIFTLVIKEFRYEHLFPILKKGVKPVLRGALTPAGWRGEAFILMMFIPYLNKYRQARTAALKSVLVLSVILVLDIVICIGVFDVQVAHYLFPVYNLAYYIVWSLVLFVNSAETIKFFSEYFPAFAFTFEIIIPLGLLILAVIRKKSSLQQKGGKAG